MADITSTSIDSIDPIETITDLQVDSVTNQEHSTVIQNIVSFLKGKSHKILDKIGQSFKALSKILSIFKTIARYGFWIKYLLAFVVFILLPLGIIGFCHALWFLIKGLAFIIKKNLQ